MPSNNFEDMLSFLFGGDNGKHRRTATALYGSTDNSAYNGTGRSDAVITNSNPTITAVTANGGSGGASISPSQQSLIQQAYDQLMQQMLQQQQTQMLQSMYGNSGLLGQAGMLSQWPPSTLLGSLHHIAAAPSPPHPPTKLKSEGIKAGEIIAWRAWQVVGGMLHSVVAAKTPWSATEPMRGDPASGYGVHAYKGPHGPLLDGYVEKGSAGHWVIGEVALWGDIIEHEEGYRSEFARVHSLVTWHESVSKSTRAAVSSLYLARGPIAIKDAA